MTANINELNEQWVASGQTVSDLQNKAQLIKAINQCTQNWDPFHLKRQSFVGSLSGILASQTGD